MLERSLVRRSAALGAVWVAVSALLWCFARCGAGATDTPAPALRSVPGNIAALAIAPARAALRGRMAREPAFAASSAMSGGVIVLCGTLCVAAWKRFLARSAPGTDHSRRVFVARLGAGGAVCSTAGTLTKATVVDPLDLRVRRYRVPIRNLPHGLDGLRIAHLTDWHVGSRVPLEVLEASTRAALEAKPDLIALTGDYVHANVGQIPAMQRILAPLCAPRASRFGVVGVLGNHDYYAGAEHVRASLTRLGVTMLDNDRRLLAPGGWTRDPAGVLCVAGLADMWMDTPVQERALGGLPDGTPRIVLSHQPDSAEHFGWRTAGAARADLMLCGHTHGGQVRLPLLGTPVVPSRYGQKYAGGLVDGPHFPVLVSRGIGMSVLPVRWNVPPEVVVVELVSES